MARLQRFIPRPGRRGGAFTLVELIVVVAIISLLVSLLLPALAAARGQARIIQCASNQRQLGIAWQAYLAEHNDVFPYTRQRELNIQWYYGGKHPAMSQANFQLQHRPLNPYVGERLTNADVSEVFFCPDDAGVRPDRGGLVGGGTWGHTMYEWHGNSYMANGNVLRRPNPGNPHPLPRRISDVKLSHSRVILAGDAHWYYAITNSPYTAAAHNDHDQMNILFLDGSVRYTQILRGERHTPGYTWRTHPPPPEEDDGS